MNVTDGAGNDVPIPDNVRFFYADSTSHTPSSLTTNAILQPDFTVNRTAPVQAYNAGALVASTAFYRALLVSLINWTKGYKKPLETNYPLLSTGELVIPTSDPFSVSTPDLSNIGTNLSVPYNGIINNVYVTDESVYPPIPDFTKKYILYVPICDQQGNEIPGINMPDIAVPLATFKNYCLRKSGYSNGNQYGLNTSQIAFALNIDSKNPNDTRKTVQELYGTKEEYIRRYKWVVY